jgi:hypothetical protein
LIGDWTNSDEFYTSSDAMKQEVEGDCDAFIIQINIDEYLKSINDTQTRKPKIGDPRGVFFILSFAAVGILLMRRKIRANLE